MNELNVKLSPKDILEQKFNFTTRGYSPEEVDAYLDLIIKDCKEYIRFIRLLDSENQKLVLENNDLKNQLRKQKVQFDSISEMTETGMINTSNVDMLRRLSNLEKIVYGKDE